MFSESEEAIVDHITLSKVSLLTAKFLISASQSRSTLYYHLENLKELHSLIKLTVAVLCIMLVRAISCRSSSSTQQNVWKPQQTVDGSRVTLMNFNHGHSHWPFPSVGDSFAEHKHNYDSLKDRRRKSSGEEYSHQTPDVFQKQGIPRFCSFCLNCPLGGILAKQFCTKLFSLGPVLEHSSVDKPNFWSTKDWNVWFILVSDHFKLLKGNCEKCVR